MAGLTTSAPPLDLPARGPSGAYRARERASVTDLYGAELAQLSQVSALYVSRTIAAMRSHGLRPGAGERERMLRKAGEIFAGATIDGLDPSAYQAQVARASGLGITVVENSTSRIASFAASALERTHFARPRGVVDPASAEAAAGGGAYWARRGEVFAVLAAGNHPGVHTHWLEALALGYRVAVRPSRREPFTPSRLVQALHLAGFTGAEVAFIPTGHDAADALVAAADRSMVYGGDDVIAKYGGDPSVLLQGPGRSKMLIGEGIERAAALDLVAEAVARGGGMSCLNATTVLVQRDAAGFAADLATRLSAVVARDAFDPEAVLQQTTLASAERLVSVARAVAGDATPVLLPRADPLGDGTAVVTPAVHVLARPDAPQARAELPFPCVWVAAWNPADGVAPLRDSLVVSLVGVDRGLRDAALEEPSIRNVYRGAYSTFWSAPAVPHDGYLGDFLMEAKGFVDTEVVYAD